MRRFTALILSMIALLSFSTMVMALSCSGSCKKDRCLLCGIPDDASASMDSAPDGIGILNFNDFSINTLRICGQGPDASGYDSNMDSPKGSGSAVRIDSNLDRRIAEVTISIRKGSRPLYKKMSRSLCDDCCEKIIREDLYDVAFIDCRTREIYPIEEDIVEFYIGDYAVHRLDSGGNSYRYLIFFAPER